VETLLFVGKWNAITRDQERILQNCVRDYAPSRVFFVICGADQANNRRYPLSGDERHEIVKQFAQKHTRYHEIYRVPDVADGWVEHLQQAVSKGSNGRSRLDPSDTYVLTANAEVKDAFESAGYTAIQSEFVGASPNELIGNVVAGRSGLALANEGTTKVYTEKKIDERIRKLYSDIALTDEGELSHNRDFGVYARGMDANLALKVQDLLPHVQRGRIVDKGCGTGSLLVELSKAFPESQIVGLDLSRELLRIADGRHYPHSNVMVAKGNIVQRHFPPGSVNTAIFASVIHEIYSYGGYNRDVVRLALMNNRAEMARDGVLLLRDGVRPPDRRVWMRLDGETQARFRRFSKEFKGGVGIRFEEKEQLKRTWFLLNLAEANEFLSKKDYLENWDAEVKEEFGVFTLDEWKKELEAIGYRIVSARSYLNPWIVEHRYKNKAWLHADGGLTPGDEIPYPDTTMVIVAQA
jgi:SAM-dependent methyltransferase